MYLELVDNEMMDRSLLKNTAYLYILTFSNYFFGFITLPYQTRVLGPEIYGILGFAAAFQVYFNLILDFGFLLSGTKFVAENANDKNELSRILSGITISKILLFIIITFIFILVSVNITYLWIHVEILLLYLFLAGINSLLPDYLYRGLEQMRSITVRTLITRICFTSLIFIFLKSPEQYYMVPLFQIVGTIVALIWVYNDIHHKFHLHFSIVNIEYIKRLYKDSLPYFLSRIASSIYNVTNTVILGFVYSSGNILGYYSSVDRIRGLAAQGCSPIADSFYPYMLRSRDYKSLFRITFVIEILILISCALLWVFSEQICAIVFGSEFADAATIFRYIIPLIAIILPTYMFGFPALSPLGLAKWANISVEIAMVNQLIWILILFFTNQISVYTICSATISSEVICMSTRICVFGWHYYKIYTK